MQYLTRDNLMGLEQYAGIRPTFRAEVMAHKRDRQVAIGPHATLYFEDRLTMQYQVQEMLRIERVFEAEGIEDELVRVIEKYNAYDRVFIAGFSEEPLIKVKELSGGRIKRSAGARETIEFMAAVKRGEAARVPA